MACLGIVVVCRPGWIGTCDPTHLHLYGATQLGHNWPHEQGCRHRSDPARDESRHGRHEEESTHNMYVYRHQDCASTLPNAIELVRTLAHIFSTLGCGLDESRTQYDSDDLDCSKNTPTAPLTRRQPPLYIRRCGARTRSLACRRLSRTLGSIAPRAFNTSQAGRLHPRQQWYHRLLRTVHLPLRGPWPWASPRVTRRRSVAS